MSDVCFALAFFDCFYCGYVVKTLNFYSRQ